MKTKTDLIIEGLGTVNEAANNVSSLVKQIEQALDKKYAGYTNSSLDILSNTKAGTITVRKGEGKEEKVYTVKVQSLPVYTLIDSKYGDACTSGKSGNYKEFVEDSVNRILDDITVS